jgi:hypothetical protein
MRSSEVVNNRSLLVRDYEQKDHLPAINLWGTNEPRVPG